MLRAIDIDGSILAFSPTCRIYISSYSNYIINLLGHVLPGLEQKVNILFISAEENNLRNYDFKNENKTIRLNFNDEHTIFKTNIIALQKTFLDSGSIYNKRFGCFCGGKILNYKENDFIIDYSVPNILNVKEAGVNSKLSFQHLYISPALYHKELNFNKENRNIDVLTTYINSGNERREKIFSDMSNNNINHTNLSKCFNPIELGENLINSKIIVNVHQKDTNQTFEELRCLPALMKGVIVISEHCVLENSIPYGNMIIWCNYKDILKYTKYVLQNYNAYHSKIFNKANIKTLENLHLTNIDNIKKILV